MRITAWLLPCALVLAVLGGCSTSRFGLAKSDSPSKKAKDADVVEYGNPWKKPKKDVPVEPKEMPPELAKLKRDREEAKDRPADVTPWLKNAAVAESKGELGAAKELYKKILDKAPNNAEAHHRLAVIADQQQDPQTADLHYQTALKLNRRDADLLSDMGYSLYLRGKLDESESRLKDALEANPYHRGAQSNMGLVYARQGKYDQALAAFRQAGTESEAQRHMAQLFPNGHPNGASPGANFADANRRGAPAMPTDIDQQLAGASLADVKARMQQEREASIRARQEQQQREFRPEVNPFDSPPAATAGRTNSPPGMGYAAGNAPANSNPNWPPVATSPPATFNANAANNEFANRAAGPTNVAKPADENPFWTGNLGTNAAGEVGRQPAPGPNANGAFAQNMSPSANPPTNFNPAAAGNAPRANWMGNDFAQPNLNPGNFAANPSEIQPAGFNDFAQPGGAMGSMNEASRLAAQMAMTTGPGGLLPVVNAGRSVGGNSSGNNVNGVIRAYEESNGTGNQNVDHAVYTRPQGSDRGIPAANTSNSNAPFSALAPAQPWGDWQSPAPAPIDWQNGAGNNNAVNPPAWNPNGASSGGGSANSLPAWSGGNNGSAGNNPAGGNVDMTRWNDGPTGEASRKPARPDSSSMGNPNGNPTTIPNWPYAPGRP